MTLELPNLDDRTFQQLVDEAKRRIPQYCPEWTNHNVGDPGVALIELFAYMTEITLFRVNKLPDRLYSLLLNLVGIEQRSATKATTELRFWFAALPLSGGESSLLIPRNVEVATSPVADGSKIAFAVDEDVTVRAAELTAFVAVAADGTTGDIEQETRQLKGAAQSVTCFEPLERGAAFYLGFTASLARAIVRLEVTASAQGTGIRPDDPPIDWQAYSNGRWESCERLGDTTGGLNRDGAILLQMPSHHEHSTVGNRGSYWLRAVLTQGDDEHAPHYKESPRITTLAVQTIGAVVPASHASTVYGPMFLGYSDGLPGQRFELNPHVLPRDDDHVVKVLDDPSAFGPTDDDPRWDEVVDFGDSGPDDAHVVWEEVDGWIRFGPSVRDDHGRPRQLGKVPPKGAAVWVTGYRCGGGRTGNVGARQLIHLHQTLKRVERVENPKPATGGTDPESIDDLKASGPQLLRAGGRAVTPRDYEELTRRDVDSVGRVVCARALKPDGPIRLLTLPAAQVDPRSLTIDDLAITEDTVADVKRVLEPVRMVGVEIEVTTPYYQGVTIVVRIRPRHKERETTVLSDNELQEAILTELYRMVDPYVGGPDHDGWPITTDLTSRDVAHAVAEFPGVQRVEDVALFEVDLRGGADRAGERTGPALSVVPLDPDSLFVSFRHQVVIDHASH